MNKIILTLLFFVCCSQDVKAQPDNRNSQREQQNATGQPSPVPVNSRQAEIDDTAKAASEAYRKDRDAKEDAFRIDQSRQNKAISDATVFMARATAVNVFIAAVYALFAYLTLRSVKKQAEHASEQVGVTRNQLTAMDRERRVLHTHAGAMFASARYTKQMLNETHNLVSQNADAVAAMQGQLEAMRGQLAAVEGQEKVMREQAKLMDRSLVLGTRAYVGVHSIVFEQAKERILLQVENIGRVPAKDIQVVIELVIRMIEHFMPVPEPSGERKGWKYHPGMKGGAGTLSRPGEWELRIPWLHSYGRTKLFPGSLRIGIVIPLGFENLYISPQQYAEIKVGNAKIFVRGVITYSDGFHKGKRTEFSFTFNPRQSLWISIPETAFDLYHTGPEQPDSDYNPNKDTPQQ